MKLFSFLNICVHSLPFPIHFQSLHPTNHIQKLISREKYFILVLYAKQKDTALFITESYNLARPNRWPNCLNLGHASQQDGLSDTGGQQQHAGKQVTFSFASQRSARRPIIICQAESKGQQHNHAAAALDASPPGCCFCVSRGYDKHNKLLLAAHALPLEQTAASGRAILPIWKARTAHQLRPRRGEQQSEEWSTRSIELFKHFSGILGRTHVTPQGNVL